MKLELALDQISQLHDDYVVFAKKPWSLHSEALIGKLDTDLRVPKNIADQGFDYFIDAAVAHEVLEVLADRETTPQQRHDLLLYYASHDAYPDWVYRED
jgi:hypothetical protein